MKVRVRSTAKNYCPVSRFSLINKVFEKLVNDRIVDHLEKCGLFSDFQYGFRSFWSTADLLTVVSDRIARAFNRYGATLALALNISKAFDRIWHAAFLHKLRGIVNIAEPCKCDICLVSRILWHQRINPLKEWRYYIWYSRATFCYDFSLQVYAAPFLWRLVGFIEKNIWCGVLEANKKQVPLKFRINSVNQILKNKEKVT